MILKSMSILLLTAATAISADQGAISGRVLTAAGKGAAVPKAPIEVRNLDTKATYKVQSTPDGSYELGGLPAGAYEISVNYPPFFLPFHQTGVQVTEGKTTRLDFRLDDFNLNTLGDGGEQFVRQLADKPVPSGPVSSTSDGKPDLSGVWQGARPSPGAEEPQPLPWAEAIAKERRYTAVKDFPLTRCLPGGISIEGMFTEYRIVQTSTLVIIIDADGDPARQIYLDGRTHPNEFNPSWMGHSVGHWENDTLVVETTGFNELGWLSVGHEFFPQTEQLRITERFRRTDLGHLEVETTYDDPGTFKKPFTVRRINLLAPKDWEVLEYVCGENNRDLEHIVVEK